MEVLAELSQVQVKRLPGTLGVHEEYAVTLAKVTLPFLDLNPSQSS
jgi:hypothetical protein